MEKNRLFSVLLRTQAIILAVSLLGGIVGALIELREDWAATANGKTLAETSGAIAKYGKNKKTAQKALNASAIPQSELLVFLPRGIDNYKTLVRHGVPGEEDAVEAFYEPESEEFNLVTPIVVYVKIIFYDSEKTAQVRAREQLEALYPDKRGLGQVNDTKVISGFASDSTGYALIWTKKNYSFEVAARFTKMIPGTPNNWLEQQAETIVKQIMKASAQGLM